MMVFREYDLLVYLLNKQALIVAEGDSDKLVRFSFLYLFDFILGIFCPEPTISSNALAYSCQQQVAPTKVTRLIDLRLCDPSSNPALAFIIQKTLCDEMGWSRMVT